MRVLLVVAAIVSITAVNGSDEYDLEHRRHTREAYPFGQSQEFPEYEIVIARYRENQTTLAWLAELPSFYQVTIINKVCPCLQQASAKGCLLSCN